MYRVWPSSTGLWRLVSDFFGSVEAQLDSIPEQAAHDLAGQLIALVSLALEADDRETSLDPAELRAAIYRRSAAVIRTHIADPGLSPARIAAMAGVSVRTLHRAFQDAGESLGDHLLNARLEACRAALDDPGKAQLSIGEIACRAGFRSQAHFANTFKRRFGYTASDWRGRGLRASG
jgi:transcriptional regulator GlxA family with amidase domain